MFLKWYRKKIAEAVEEKMYHMRTCPNERDIILHIIAPKDYAKFNVHHCNKDCRNYECCMNFCEK